MINLFAHPFITRSYQYVNIFEYIYKLKKNQAAKKEKKNSWKHINVFVFKTEKNVWIWFIWQPNGPNLPDVSETKMFKRARSLELIQVQENFFYKEEKL